MQSQISMSILGVCATKKNIDPKWREFPKLLIDSGLNLVACESEIQNHHFDLEAYPHTLKFFGKSLDTKHRTLIRVEPVVVNPFQYQPSVENKYGNIIVISPCEAKTDRYIYWESGYIDFNLIKPTNTQLRSGTGMINNNKFSFVVGSNYKLRKKIIELFVANDKLFKLAGKDWDKKIFWYLRKQASALLRVNLALSQVSPSQFQLPLSCNSSNFKYFGRVESVISFLSECKFAVVIENDSTYVSEKLLNAVIAGCVPIYHGPPLQSYGIPSSIAINLSDCSLDFLKAVETTSEFNCNQIIKAGKNWIKSVETQERWSVHKGFERLVKVMKSQL
jgi:hypothetical protein